MKRRKKSFENLKKVISSQQIFFKKFTFSQKSSTLASYLVAHKIAKSNKPFSEGEFVKECIIDVCKVLCPEKLSDFESLSLSRKTITTRIDAIASNLCNQLSERAEKFKYFSITMDKSTDRSDTAQVLLFIRGIDEDFNITEELASIQSLKGKTTGEIIYNEFTQCLKTLNVSISSLCNIPMDGAPNMVGKNVGFAGIFARNNIDVNVQFLHCIIHQDVLCKAAIDIDRVLSVVLKIINSIKSRGLIHRQFQELLAEVDSDYSDLLYFTKVRWLSCGHAFKRVWSLKNEITDFLKNKTEKWSEFEIFEDKEWLCEFAFITDLLEHYNKLNTKLQGRNQFIDKTWGCIKAFESQLLLFCRCFERNDLSHFPRLSSFKPVKENILQEFCLTLKKLSSEFEKRFQDFQGIQSSLGIFSMPFNVEPVNVSTNLQLEIIEMQNSAYLKQLFLNSSQIDFYRLLPKAEFPNIIAHAQKIMAMFASSYVYEQTFSVMKLRKSSIRNRLTDEHLFPLLKVASSPLDPSFEDLITNQKQLYFSHTTSKKVSSNKDLN